MHPLFFHCWSHFFLLDCAYFDTVSNETAQTIQATKYNSFKWLKCPWTGRKLLPFSILFPLLAAVWNLMTIFSPFFLSYDQIMKETRKTVVPKVIVATPKVKEQDLVSRSREGITTKREQVQITQEKVNTRIWDGKSWSLTNF